MSDRATHPHYTHTHTHTHAHTHAHTTFDSTCVHAGSSQGESWWQRWCFPFYYLRWRNRHCDSKVSGGGMELQAINSSIELDWRQKWEPALYLPTTYALGVSDALWCHINLHGLQWCVHVLHGAKFFSEVGGCHSYVNMWKITYRSLVPRPPPRFSPRLRDKIWAEAWGRG